MNPCLIQIMRDHGLHKHISVDCQHRMEFLYEYIVRECAKLSADSAGYNGLNISDKILKNFGVDK